MSVHRIYHLACKDFLNIACLCFVQVDYLARAKRIEEIPLLLKQYEEDKKVGREFWEQQEQERVSNHYSTFVLV